MLKKILALCAALALSVTVLAGCNNDDSEKTKSTTKNESSQNNKEEMGMKAPVADGKIDVTKGPTENMLTRSVMREGDRSRLAAKLQNAIDNPQEMTTIAYFGDSITAGSSASAMNQYTTKFTKWWENNISMYCETVNAGIGATDSYLAVHRAESDVLSKNPDIIFIEFINDQNNEFYKSTMDSLVRKCLSAEGSPAVILVEMTMDNGTTPQQAHSVVAEAYDIPVISYYDAVFPEVEAGNIEWSEISPDNIHPNDNGHALLGEMLINYVSSVKDDLDNIDKEIKTELAQSPTGDIYANATMADRDSDLITVVDEGSFSKKTFTSSVHPNGWSTTTAGSFTFEVEARNIGMLYLKDKAGRYGMVKIYVDGEEVKSINADFTGGWGSYACMEQFYTSDETAKHTVTVEMPEGEKTKFDIYKLLIS